MICIAPPSRVLSRPPAVYPGDLGVYQDRMPLYINCTEVTHIYTNGSYQLVYQNCTPLFVRTKQVGYCIWSTSCLKADSNPWQKQCLPNLMINHTCPFSRLAQWAEEVGRGEWGREEEEREEEEREEEEKDIQEPELRESRAVLSWLRLRRPSTWRSSELHDSLTTFNLL